MVASSRRVNNRGINKVATKGDLLRLQRAFATYIREPLGDGDRLAHRVRMDDRVGLMISPSPTLAPHQRIELYAQQYWWRLAQSLDEDFPLVQRLLGSRYIPVRTAYLSRFPSRSFTLRDLGRRLPRYLLRHRPGGRLLSDCAQMEWALIEAFDARDEKPLDRELVEKRSFHRRILRLQSHVTLLPCAYPVHHLLRRSASVQHGATSNAISRAGRVGASGRSQSLPRQQSWLVIHRQGWRVLVKAVSRDEFRLLEHLRNGVSLEVLARRASRIRTITPESFHAFFRDWSSFGWLTVERRGRHSRHSV